MNRRVFLRGGGFALVSLGLDPLFLGRLAYARARPDPATDGKTLVCLFQRGAVDGLNMVIPHGEPEYYRSRPRIAVPRNSVVDLDGRFGLHPALASLLPWWTEGKLAVVHAAGSPDPTRSHFDAQDYMESGTPGRKSTPDGWLNRACRHDREHASTPFQAVAFGPRLPRILAGSAPALAIDDLRTFGLRPDRATGGDRLNRAFASLYGAADTGLVASSGREAFDALARLREANPSGIPAAAGVEYPAGRFGMQMGQIAQLIKAGLGVRVAFADLGGWDTHVNQGGAEGQLAARLRELGLGLAAFARDLGDRMAEVVVLTMSEFGRTIAENGSAGTDHGHGTAMLVLGGGVQGGRVLGRWPGLEHRHDGRDLPVTTDFRDLFGEVVDRHLGVRDLAEVFPGYASAPGRYPGVMGEAAPG